MRSYTKVHRNVYARTDVELTALDRAHAAWLWSGRRAILVGHSASAQLGSRWIPVDAPVELARSRRPGAPGIKVRSGEIRDDEVCTVGCINCTTPARTAYDLGRRLPLETAAIRIDALLNATKASILQVESLALRYPGARGIRHLRTALDLADAGAESPQETRLRLLLVRSGLPRPVTQIPVTNDWGRVASRIDMGWPECMVGAEYDGQHHWTDPAGHGATTGGISPLTGHRNARLFTALLDERVQRRCARRRQIKCKPEAGRRPAGTSSSSTKTSATRPTRQFC